MLDLGVSVELLTGPGRGRVAIGQAGRRHVIDPAAARAGRVVVVLPPPDSKQGGKVFVLRGG